MIVMILLPAFSGMAGMIQFDDPCATPAAPALVVQLTCALPEPPDTVPLIAIEDTLLELGGAMTASTSGLTGTGAGVGFGLGLGFGLDALLGAAYNSWMAAMSFGIRTVCLR